jgi:hypothetical protein
MQMSAENVLVLTQNTNNTEKRVCGFLPQGTISCKTRNLTKEITENNNIILN